MEDGTTLGVFQRHQQIFDLTSLLDRYGMETYRSPLPAGWIQVNTPGLTQEQATEMRSKFQAAHRGPERGIAILNSASQFHPLMGMSPTDAALVDIKTANIVEVAFAFNLEASMLEVAPKGGGMTYSNIGQRYSHYRITSLGPWQVAVTEILNMMFPGDTGLFIDLASLLRADVTTRYAAHDQALPGGWKTVDEIRAEEGLPPLNQGETNDSDTD